MPAEIPQVKHQGTTQGQRSHALTALMQTARITAFSLKPSELAQAVLKTVVQAFDAEAGVVFVLDDETRTLRMLAHHGHPADFVQAFREIPAEHPNSLHARVLRTGEPLFIENLPQQSGLVSQQDQIKDGIPRAALIVPLIAQGRPIGTIAIGYLSDRRFNPKDLSLLATIGQQMGTGIQNARLAQDAQARADRLATIGRLAQRLNTEQDLDKLLQAVVDAAARLLQAEESALYLNGDGQAETRAIVANASTTSSLLDPVLAEEIVKYVANTGDTIISPVKARKSGRFSPLKALEETDRPLLCVSLIHRGQKLGALLVVRARARPFRSADVELLSTFASHAAIAIYNARLRQEMERRAHQLQTLVQMSTQLSATLDWDLLATQIARYASELAHVPRTVLLLYDPEHNELVVKAVQGYQGDLPLHTMRFPLNQGVLPIAFRTRRPIMTPRLGDEPYYTPYPGLEEVADWSFLFVPLLVGQDPIGVLAFSDEAGRIYSETERETLILLANHVAIAITNARLFAEMEARQTQLEALNEIAATIAQVRDLHQVLDLILERLAAVVHHHGALIMLMEEDETYTVAARGCPYLEDLIGIRACVDMQQEDWQQGSLHMTVDRAHICSWDRGAPESPCPNHAQVKAPLVVQGEVIGCIEVCRSGEDGFHPQEAKLVQAFANHAAVAIHNARLYNTLQRHSAVLEAKVAAQTKELQAALERAQEADRLKSAFLAMISHELRSPLASIKGFASTLLQDDVEWDRASQREFLSIIEYESDKLSELIDQLLDMSRLESGTLEVKPVPCPLEAILEDVMERLHMLAKSHQLQVTLPPDLPRVFADRQRIGQVLSNLVENAAKYSPAGSTIAIGATADTDWMTVSVSDQGVGIAQEFHKRIFEEFFRIPEDQNQPGTGLGLAICRGIIEAHGGRIWVESEPQKGSTFKFTLPIVHDAEANEVDI